MYCHILVVLPSMWLPEEATRLFRTLLHTVFQDLFRLAKLEPLDPARAFRCAN